MHRNMRLFLLFPSQPEEMGDLKMYCKKFLLEIRAATFIIIGIIKVIYAQ